MRVLGKLLDCKILLAGYTPSAAFNTYDQSLYPTYESNSMFAQGESRAK